MDENKTLNGSESETTQDSNNFENRNNIDTTSRQTVNTPDANYVNAETMSDEVRMNEPDNVRHGPFVSHPCEPWTSTPSNNADNPYWQNQNSANPYWQNQNPYEGQEPKSGEENYDYSYGQNNNQTQEQMNYQTQENQQPTDTEDGKKTKKCNKDRCKIAMIPVICAIAGFILGALLFYCRPSSTRVETLPDESQSEKEIETTIVYRDNNDLSDVIESTMDSIVSISSTVTYEQFNFFTGYQQYDAASGGSGIIVGKDDANLYIVTNNHVVADAKDITIQFSDGADAEAEINGTSTDPDVAILTVSLDELSADTQSKIKIAKLHTDDDLKIGNQVIAIGNALGYGQSVTVGYISALNRTIQTTNGTASGLIQTDAAINPGNSGGALINVNGEVIGINVAKYSSTDVEGIGYSIPITAVNDLIDILSKEKVDKSERGYLGIQCTTVDQSMATMYDMPQGVYVYKIMNDSVSEDGLMEHDIITSIDDHIVTTASNLTDYLSYYKAGNTVKLVVERIDDGEFKEVELQIKLIHYSETIEQDN